MTLFKTLISYNFGGQFTKNYGTQQKTNTTAIYINSILSIQATFVNITCQSRKQEDLTCIAPEITCLLLSESVERRRREIRVSRLAASPCSQDTRDLTIFKKNKRLLEVCIPFNHFIRVTRVFQLSEKVTNPFFTSRA